MEDPHTSFKALAKGIGAEHSEMTPVILTSAPHEMQNQPHSSLLLTPRLPIDGEPCECKQEVADSVVTAGHMNRTVELAKPTKMVADVDRTAPLDGEPAEMACGVDEGDEMECEPQTCQVWVFSGSKSRRIPDQGGEDGRADVGLGRE